MREVSKIEKLQTPTRSTDIFENAKLVTEKINEIIESVNLQEEQIQRLREFIYRGGK